MPRTAFHIPTNQDTTEYMEEFLKNRLQKIKFVNKQIVRWEKQMKDCKELIDKKKEENI